MAEPKQQSKYQFTITPEQSKRMAALGKLRRRKLCPKMRVAFDGALTDLEITHEKTRTNS